MTAQPAPAANKLTDEINAHLVRGRKVDEFTIRALERKANALKGKIDFDIYYNFLGQIAALRRNHASVIEHFEKALKLNANNPKILTAYLIALDAIGKHSEALERGRALVKKHNDSELLSALFQVAIHSGRYREAYGLLDALEKSQQAQWQHILTKSIEIIDEAQLEDDETEKLQQLAFSIIPKLDLYHSHVGISVARNCIHCVITVDLPIEDIFNVNWELAEVLVENTDNTHSDILLFEYSSIDVYEERNAS